MFPPISQAHVFIFLLFTSLLIFLLSFWYHVDIASYAPGSSKKMLNNNVQCATIAQKNLSSTPKETIILLWNWPWGERFDLDWCQSRYGIHDCKLTVNRDVYSTADAVLMHHGDLWHNKQYLPKQPRPNFQRWVWLNIEPPMKTGTVKTFEHVFNMTMSYRRDSDIYIPYGQLEPLREPQNFTFPYKKTKLVAWAVSRWYGGAARYGYYRELKKHIEIDIYGHHNIRLNQSDFHTTIGQYKFYLAFENSIYKDYITEKLWRNAFGSWAVPVVLGTTRANYEEFVPGDAFIHVDDFTNPKELADYLHKLDKDNEKYMNYFNWRSWYIIHSYDFLYQHCQACVAIKQSSKYQTVRNLSSWFLGGL